MTTAPAAEVAVAVLAADTVRLGAVVSCTVTVKVLSPLLPALSVAEQVTVVAPMGNTVPDALLQVAVSGPSTSSLAVTPISHGRAVRPGRLGGDVRRDGDVGLVWSCTSMVKVAVPVLPAASVAVQVTVVMPRAKVLPDAGVQVTGKVPIDQVVGGGAGVDDVVGAVRRRVADDQVAGAGPRVRWCPRR